MHCYATSIQNSTIVLRLHRDYCSSTCVLSTWVGCYWYSEERRKRGRGKRNTEENCACSKCRVLWKILGLSRTDLINDGMPTVEMNPDMYIGAPEKKITLKVLSSVLRSAVSLMLTPELTWIKCSLFRDEILHLDLTPSEPLSKLSRRAEFRISVVSLA